MARYLNRVRQAWSLVIGEDDFCQNRLDANTVQILQGRCPFWSLNDRAYIERRFSDGEILPVYIKQELANLNLNTIRRQYLNYTFAFVVYWSRQQQHGRFDFTLFRCSRKRVAESYFLAQPSDCLIAPLAEAAYAVGRLWCSALPPLGSSSSHPVVRVSPSCFLVHAKVCRYLRYRLNPLFLEH